MSKFFHAYDIRGIYNIDFDKNDVYKIGFFLTSLLKTDKILVGRDVRVSSPEIYEYLVKGIIDSGANVYNAGLATTPMIYYLTAKHHFDASVMITASHNSKEYNGIKVSGTDASPIGYDAGLNVIENLVNTKEIVIAEKKGEVISFDVKNDYISFLHKYLTDISNLKVGIDSSNGMSALLIKDILGDTPIYINNELDGNFPSHDPNPLVEANTNDIKKLVIDQKCDIGLIFDGDADRVMFIDEKGNFIQPDLMIAVLAEHFLKNESSIKPKVLHDIRTSKSVTEYIQSKGGEAVMWKVGRAFASVKLREIDGLFGGELAGHYYFKDFYFSDSGILMSLIVLEILNNLKSEGIAISNLIEKINKYYSSGELNLKIENKKEAMELLKDTLTEEEKLTAFYDFDGYRIEFKDWWFNIRPSNTEPYLRLLIEANTEIILKEKASRIKNLLKRFEI
ncbi:MAG: phosphomannomutase/phosphoglucomutase [Bacteroidales bacterium]|nr:phosphomannomutase/phosphoglucomutase [Bacteroidales bacterium]MBN2758573.1 phosphomannomutase/phosphoglucomutase [Bacteroidales bacterium]